ncbi:leucine-rich repeat transmembrane neuronal protein 2 [Malaya genurostris]|uniref:leucine-rich repeat transmembrane neuronal protein 2 n=1 Tax=Malaya genurostris TaxID=325434 RepID=UPI0026F38AA6|nr:leucine-rich repeat transmembrane neuronal protein 2 [Malaya genurostris]
MDSKFVVIGIVLLSYILLIEGSVITNHNGRTEVCPKMCTCDIIEGLKRADCSQENLINTYTDVPASVEILDLSINKISTVEDDSLMEYSNLVKLFLSDNSINTISLNAFAGLPKLEVLDLSHNRLEKVHEDLFEHNEKLTDLNLSNNNFIALENRPLLKSSSIMYLHMSDCKIPQLYESLFLYMPSLRTIDLSENLMITLSKEPFIHLKKLRSINLHENRWQCDSSTMRGTINWMKKRIASIQIDNCFINPYKSKAMFEKMEMDPSLREGKNNRHEVPIDKLWGLTTQTTDYWSSLKEKSCAYNEDQDSNSRKTCEDFVECQNRFNELYYAYAELKSHNGLNINTKHISRLATTLLLCGIFIGALFGFFATYSVMCLIEKCCKNSNNDSSPRTKTVQELRREFRKRNLFEHTRLNDQRVADSPSGHPVSHLSSREQSQIYRNHENTRQFLVNLFSKRRPRFVRNNSQITNLQNRYIPPIQIRSSPNASPAPTSSSFVWESMRENEENQDREQMLDSHNESRQSSVMAVWNNYYGIDELRRPESSRASYEVVPICNTAASVNRMVLRETPPPPYVDCNKQSN